MQIKDEIYKSIAGVAGTILLGIIGWLVAVFRSRATKAELLEATTKLKEQIEEMDQAYRRLRAEFEEHYYTRRIIDDMFGHQDKKIDDIRHDIKRLEDSLATSISGLGKEIVDKIGKLLEDKR